jgi:hypothetical protein
VKKEEDNRHAIYSFSRMSHDRRSVSAYVRAAALAVATLKKKIQIPYINVDRTGKKIAD